MLFVGEAVAALTEALRSSSGRLSLLGGPSAVLGNMQADRVVPDVITLSLLLELLPNTSDHDERFILNTADHLQASNSAILGENASM